MNDLIHNKYPASMLGSYINGTPKNIQWVTGINAGNAASSYALGFKVYVRVKDEIYYEVRKNTFFKDFPNESFMVLNP